MVTGSTLPAQQPLTCKSEAGRSRPMAHSCPPSPHMIQDGHLGLDAISYSSNDLPIP